MVIERIQAKTLRQMVYEELRHKIILAELLPGESITLRDLAQKFGVSLMPVREALWQLESEKIIVIESNKQIRVNALSSREMEEALRLRLLLEGTAAERACELRPEAELPRLKRILRTMASAIDRPRIYMRRNTEFHFAIYEQADSPLLVEMIERLWARVDPYVYSLAIAVEHQSEAMKHHEDMLRALVSRNKRAMAEALRRDLGSTAQRILGALRKANGLFPETIGSRRSSSRAVPAAGTPAE